MELPATLLELLDKRRDEIESLELTYRNGGKVTGQIRNFRVRPFKLVIRKSVLQAGERPRHRVVPGHLTEFSLTLKDGQTFRYS
jgi:hypothetical protein